MDLGAGGIRRDAVGGLAPALGLAVAVGLVLSASAARAAGPASTIYARVDRVFTSEDGDGRLRRRALFTLDGVGMSVGLAQGMACAAGDRIQIVRRMGRPMQVGPQGCGRP